MVAAGIADRIEPRLAGSLTVRFIIIDKEHASGRVFHPGCDLGKMGYLGLAFPEMIAVVNSVKELEKIKPGFKFIKPVRLVAQNRRLYTRIPSIS